MRLAIIGSRDFVDFKMAEDVFFRHFYSIYHIHKQSLEIISGGCPSGGDAIGKALALKYKLNYIEFPAKWEDLTLKPCIIKKNSAGREYNALAGFNRNRDIIENCDFVLAFWQNQSKGTANSLKIAKGLKKPTMIIYF